MDASTLKTLIEAILTIISILITSVLIPFIKTKVDQNKLDKLQQYVEYAVRYAEQVYKPENWKEKKAYVSDYILEKAQKIAPGLDEEDIDILIESVVNYVKH